MSGETGREQTDLDALVEQGSHVNCPNCGYLSVYFGSRDEALIVAEAHAMSGHNGPADDPPADGREQAPLAGWEDVYRQTTLLWGVNAGTAPR